MLEPFVEQTYQSLGNNIYRFRILEQMSQVRLAEKSNISAGYISQIECAHLCKGITKMRRKTPSFSYGDVRRKKNFPLIEILYIISKRNWLAKPAARKSIQGSECGCRQTFFQTS